LRQDAFPVAQLTVIKGWKDGHLGCTDDEKSVINVGVDELLTFYTDNTKTRATDAASDAAPRRQAPAPTQPEPFNFDPSNRVAELSAITRSDADGMILHMFCSSCFSVYTTVVIV